MSINKENVQKTIDLIKYNAEIEGGVRFHMGWFTNENHVNAEHECGTSCCIAGFAFISEKGRVGNIYKDSIPTVAREYLGLSAYQTDLLFYAEDHYEGAYDATLEQGVKVLEHLRDTGDVDWTIAGFELLNNDSDDDEDGYW